MQSSDPYLRHLAGLTLKKNISIHWQVVPPQVRDFVKSCALKSISDPVEAIRNTAGTLITTIVSVDQRRWQEAIPKLMELIESPSVQVSEVI